MCQTNIIPPSVQRCCSENIYIYVSLSVRNIENGFLHTVENFRKVGAPIVSPRTFHMKHVWNTTNTGVFEVCSFEDLREGDENEGSTFFSFFCFKFKVDCESTGNRLKKLNIDAEAISPRYRIEPTFCTWKRSTKQNCTIRNNQQYNL